VGKQLKTLSKMIRQPQLIDIETVSRLVADDFTCVPLRPVKLEEVFNPGLSK